MAITIMKTFSDIVECKVSLGSFLEGAETRIKMDNFLPFQTKLVGHVLEFLIFEFANRLSFGLLREVEAHFK